MKFDIRPISSSLTFCASCGQPNKPAAECLRTLAAAEPHAAQALEAGRGRMCHVDKLGRGGGEPIVVDLKDVLGDIFGHQCSSL